MLRYNVVRNLKSLAEYAKPGGRWDSDTTIKEKKELFAGRAAEINCTITWEDDTPGCIVGIIAATATVAAAAQQGPQQGESTALVVQPASGADTEEGAGAMGHLLLLLDASACGVPGGKKKMMLDDTMEHMGSLDGLCAHVHAKLGLEEQAAAGAVSKQRCAQDAPAPPTGARCRGSEGMGARVSCVCVGVGVGLGAGVRGGVGR